ncbi:MAG: hypothetical protein HOE53_02930 [Candidatus Magasanikbacteria bacterium]|jgi:hypothetical protein|nr:hypothetical protein [Candidatus Magasanikbacteria bacterium]
MEGIVREQPKAPLSLEQLQGKTGYELKGLATEHKENPANLFWQLVAASDESSLHRRFPLSLMEHATHLLPDGKKVSGFGNNDSARRAYSELLDRAMPGSGHDTKSIRAEDPNHFPGDQKYLPRLGKYTRTEQLFAGNLVWTSKAQDLRARANIKRGTDTASAAEKLAAQAESNIQEIDETLGTDAGSSITQALAKATELAVSPRSERDVIQASRIFEHISHTLTGAINSDFDYDAAPGTTLKKHPKDQLKDALSKEWLTQASAGTTQTEQLHSAAEIRDALFVLAKALDQRSLQGRDGLTAEIEQAT